MRDELAELLGQPVVLAGRLNRCEPNAVGSLNICLKAVDVYPWRSDIAISSLSPVRVDHGWLQMPSLEHSMGGIVEMYWMTAEISSYQRKNGSRDIGFLHRPSLCLDHLLDKILNIDEYDQQLQSIQAALRRIHTREGVFGFHCCPHQIEEILQNILQIAKQKDSQGIHTNFKAQAMRLKKAYKKSAFRQQKTKAIRGFKISP